MGLDSMRQFLRISTTLIVLLIACTLSYGRDHKTLAIGSPAPDFNLLSTEGRMVSLSSFTSAKILVVIFTCNHCPTAQAYEDRIIKLTSDYKPQGVAVVAIMPNDPKSLRLDELDFSDLGDSYEEMKIRAKEKKFNFPYLYDGDNQKVSEAYGPVATPHVFIFDEKRILQYAGRFDNMESPFKTASSQDTRDAIEALLSKKNISNPSTKVFGCSIKWSEKRESVARALEKWSKEPVSLENINSDSFSRVIKDSAGKLKLIYCWNLNCKQCEKSFPEFININRMYRDRDFEFISINLDKVEARENVIAFLRKYQASNKNYQGGEDLFKKLSAIVGNWDGKFPLTLLIEPGAKLVYQREGEINPALLKKTIVENHMIGRYP
jgi:thiol-disulfide isomerase/thioredoxin